MALSHKPNLVFLHGWGTDPLVWKYQLDHFSKRYEVECPSGLNFKSQPALRGEDCVLVGWSHGGMLALKIAVGSKDIAALVLVASSAKFTDAENGMRPSIVKKIKKGLERDFEKTMIGCYSTFFSGTETAAAARFIKEQRLPDKKTAIGVLDELAALDLKDTLQKINIPTLIVHGEKDDVCPLGAGRFLHDNIKGSRLSVIEGAGHMPFYTRPEEFNRILEGFLSDAG